MWTHFTSLDLIAIAADLNQSTGSRIERSEAIALSVFVSSKARDAVGFSHGSFGSVVVGYLTEKLAIDFAQWARHITHEVLMFL